MAANLPDDIAAYVADRFAADEVDDARARLDELVEVLCGEYELSAQSAHRIVRCVCHLADGSVTELERFAEAALGDWRDVIWWAEYAGGDQHIRDFREPFES